MRDVYEVLKEKGITENAEYILDRYNEEVQK